ncbi:MAG: cysteine-rich repeat protein [Myxococcota bacterium]|jgi:cysteine-rich repeat protein
MKPTTHLVGLFSLGILALFPNLVHAACGDGVIDTGEGCDDLNTDDGDGCDSSCAYEDGWECTEDSLALDFDETVLESGHVDPTWSPVTQSSNADPAVYLSVLPANGITIEFELTVDTTTDDDFIGWVVAYESGDNEAEDAEWLLFDWRQNTQELYGCDGEEGLSYSHIDGPIEHPADLWCHEGDVAKVSRGNNLGGTGWDDETTYTIELTYTTTGFDVFVDGSLEFSETGPFPEGNFGFYNFSQQKRSSLRWSLRQACPAVKRWTPTATA